MKDKLEGGKINHLLPPKTKRKNKNTWQLSVPFLQVTPSGIWFSWCSSASLKDYVKALVDKLLPIPAFVGREKKKKEKSNVCCFASSNIFKLAGKYLFCSICHSLVSSWNVMLKVWYSTMQTGNTWLKSLSVCVLDYSLQDACKGRKGTS